MRVSLNLATRPFANYGPLLQRLRIAMGVLAVAAIAFGVGIYFLGTKADQARAQQQAVDAKIAALTQEKQRDEAEMRKPENAALLAQSAELNTLFDEKSFSWTLAMEDLERVLPAGVQAASLEPIREKNGLTTLHLRVTGPRDKAIDLVRNLEQSKHFMNPRIVGETSAEGVGGVNDRPMPVSASSKVNFDLLADLNPDSPLKGGRP